MEPQVLYLAEPADHQSAGVTLDSVHMGRFHKLKVIILLGAVTGDNPIVLCYAGATAGATTTEIAFRWRKSGADAGSSGSDILGARTVQAVDGTGLALGTAANADHRMWEIEIDSDDMPDGKPFLTIFLDDGSASVLLAAAIGIGIPREQGDTVRTAVP